MNEKKIRYFISVAKEQNLHKSAEILGISSAALSKQISALEEEWGFELFKRTNKGLILTPAGTSMYRDIGHIVRFYNEALSKAFVENLKKERRIRIGVNSMGGSAILLNLLEKVQEENPEFIYEFVNYQMSKDEIKRIVKNFGEKMDIMFNVYDSSILNEHFCRMIQVSEQALACAVPRRHRLSGKSLISLEDLKGEKCLLLKNAEDNKGNLIEERLDELGIDVEEFDCYDENMFSYSEKNNQILFALSFWRPINPLIEIIPLDWDCIVPICLYYSKVANTDTLEFVKILKLYT